MHRGAADPNPGRDSHRRWRSDRQCLLNFASAPSWPSPLALSLGAIIAVTNAIAVDHGADGIRANCISPGPVYTPMVYSRGMTEQARETRRRASVLNREGTGWDLGGATLVGPRLAVGKTAGNIVARLDREGSPSAGSAFACLLRRER